MVVYQRNRIGTKTLNYLPLSIEVDSILIDARETPLIISGQAEKSTTL